MHASISARGRSPSNAITDSSRDASWNEYERVTFFTSAIQHGTFAAPKSPTILIVGSLAVYWATVTMLSGMLRARRPGSLEGDFEHATIVATATTHRATTHRRIAIE